MTYLIDNKQIVCHHKKLDPLTARIGKRIPRKNYRDIGDIIHNDSQKYSTLGGGEDLSSQK